ncbi:MAG: PAS domain-containing protein, partial [Endomicrobium sp.]|nr:PAS domain-containing protein [Endomicrobium sp.]
MNNEIKSIVATINNFPPPPEERYTSKSVIYFCESHNKGPQERDNIRAVSNLLHRYQMELNEYEKYELRTGYLSRWNYMPKDFEQMSCEEIEEAIKRGYEEENEWLKRCEPELPRAFIHKDWKECISEKENPYYQQSKQLVVEELKRNKSFYDSFVKSSNSYAERHESNQHNGEKYVLEEVVWVFSLPLVHPNKHIYLIHVGKDNPAIKELFHVFPNFNKTVKWLSPRLREFTFKNNADFLMYYNANRNVGTSYAIDNRSIVDPFMRTVIDKNHSSLEIQSVEKILLQSIIEKLPCHVYWLNRENIYLGCNGVQAKDFGLESAKEVVGKTNFDFHDTNTAEMLNNINELVMSTEKPYEVEEDGFINNAGLRKCLSKKAPLFDPLGKVVGLLGVSFDITEKKKIEELENKLKMREELYKIAKEVSHDIASPVTSLKIIEEVYK